MDENARLAFLAALQGNPQMQEAVAAFANRPEISDTDRIMNQPAVQEGMQAGMDLAGSVAGTASKLGNMVKAPAAAGQMVPAMQGMAMQAPARGVGQGVGLIDNVAKGFGKVQVKPYNQGGYVQMNEGGFPPIPPALLPSQGPVDYSSLVPQLNPTGEPVFLSEQNSPITVPNLQGVGYQPNQPIPMGMVQPQGTGSSMFSVDDIPGMPQDMEAGPAIPPQQPQADPFNQMRGQESDYNKIVQNEFKAKEGYFKDQERIRADQAAQTQQQLQDFMQKNQALSAERDAFIQDLKESQIDPSRYMHSMSTGGKIATAIGLLVGGMSSAAENPAVKFLDKQIEQDIDAQKANLGKKENLLNANLRHFGNLKDAMAMTRIMHNDYVSHLLEQAAAKAGTPMAKAAADKQIFEYKQKNAALQAQIALSGPAPIDEAAFAQRQRMLKVMNPEQAKQEAATRVPGMGNVLQPEDAKVMKEMIATKKTAGQAIDDLLKINSTPFKSLRPEQIAKADVLQTTLVSKLKTFLAGTGTMSDKDREVITDAVANPTKFFSLDSMNKTKLETLKRTLERGVQSEGESRGIQGRSSQTQSGIRSFKPSK